MKKVLGILVLGLLFCNVGFGKISKAYYDVLFGGCMEEALKSNYSYNLTKKYCKCSADHFNKNYNDDSLLELAEGRGESAYNDVVNYVSGLCRKRVGLN